MEYTITVTRVRTEQLRESTGIHTAFSFELLCFRQFSFVYQWLIITLFSGVEKPYINDRVQRNSQNTVHVVNSQFEYESQLDIGRNVKIINRFYPH